MWARAPVPKIPREAPQYSPSLHSPVALARSSSQSQGKLTERARAWGRQAGLHPLYPNPRGCSLQGCLIQERLREDGIPGVAQRSKDKWTEQTLLCVQSLVAHYPHYLERETESQRGDKHCPSTHSKGVAELKQKPRFSDSSSNALSMTSIMWTTQPWWDLAS